MNHSISYTQTDITLVAPDILVDSSGCLILALCEFSTKQYVQNHRNSVIGMVVCATEDLDIVCLGQACVQNCKL